MESFSLQRLAMRSRRRDIVVAPPLLPHFTMGVENRLAGFVAQCDTDVLSAMFPILVVGPSGCGKTALALHLAARLSQSVPPTSDRPMSPSPWNGYWVASEFARHYAECIDAGDMNAFRNQIENVDVLVIDDLHGIADKSAAQEELATRIAGRVEQRRPTVLTCRRLPSEIRAMRGSLVSRALPGLTVPITYPSLPVRQSLLKDFALYDSLDIKPQLLEVLATYVGDQTSPRDLHATIKQLDLWARMNESPITIDAIQSVLDALTENTPSITAADITRSVARYFKLKSSDLRSDSRRQNVVRARSLAMTLCRQLTPLSLNQIGSAFGGRDHTTVLHAIRKIESSLDCDPVLRRAADELTEGLSSLSTLATSG
jgi:chromosomal replication initiator protein